MSIKGAGISLLFIVGFFTFILSLLAMIGLVFALFFSGMFSNPVTWPVAFAVLFIYDFAVCWAYLLILSRLRIFDAEKPTTMALRLWLPSLAFFTLAIVAAQAAYSNSVDSCRQECAGSTMCGAHCPGMNYWPAGSLLFMLEAAAAAGPCNPLTLLIACHIQARLKNRKRTSL